MTNSRRDFLKGTAWLGVTAVAAGCMGDRLRIGGVDLRKMGPIEGVVGDKKQMSV